MGTGIESGTPAFKSGKLTEFTFRITMEEGDMTPEKNYYCVNAGLNENPLNGNFYDFIEINNSQELIKMRYFKDIDDDLELKLLPDNWTYMIQ